MKKKKKARSQSFFTVVNYTYSEAFHSLTGIECTIIPDGTMGILAQDNLSVNSQSIKADFIKN